MIVDDDQINILVASSYLKGLKKLTFRTSSNGQEAYEIFRETLNEEKKIDIILMDCNMPGVDGIEATKLFNQFAKSNKMKEPWIIACTANTSQADFKPCFESGMKDYISKPFSKWELYSKIERFDQLFK